MKIAISLPDDLFREVDRIAREQRKSRSQVFVTAAREYIRRRETRSIVEKLDEVYSRPDLPAETAKRKAMGDYQRRRMQRSGRP